LSPIYDLHCVGGDVKHYSTNQSEEFGQEESRDEHRFALSVKAVFLKMRNENCAAQKRTLSEYAHAFIQSEDRR